MRLASPEEILERLSLDNPDCFDNWRELYSVLTNDQHKAFMTACSVRYPDQQHWTPKHFESLFTQLEPFPRVLEIGGWKGELAKHCLEKYNIKSWFNIEACEEAVEQTVPMGTLAYATCIPFAFDWFSKLKQVPSPRDYDVCVSAHMIEHLSDEHLLDLIDYLVNVPAVMFEAPIGRGTSDWRGYLGTHILKMGWNAVDEAMGHHNFRPTTITSSCTLYKKVAP